MNLYSNLKTCFDLDGVLCKDPVGGFIDDKEYIDWIMTAELLAVPRVEIFAIITGRLEKYRKPTEIWLKRHGFIYKYLLMKPDFLEGVEKTPLFKANNYLFYKESGLFIESSKWQAEKIYNYSKKPVFCIENYKLYCRKEKI